MPYPIAPEHRKIIILENNVLADGIGDYYHLKDILEYIIKSPKFDSFFFLPVIRTNDEKLMKKMEADMGSMDISQFYIGTFADFVSNEKLDEQLKPFYVRAEQVLEISVGIRVVRHRQYLSAGAVIKQILEHEKKHSFYWELDQGLPAVLDHAVLSGCLGLGSKAYGIKIAEVAKASPLALFSSLEIHDAPFAGKLLKTTQAKDTHQFLAENIFTHAYFNDFGYRNGLSRFLAVLCSKQMGKGKNVVVHLSSRVPLALELYLKRDRGREGGVNSFLGIVAVIAPYLDIKYITFFRDEDDTETKIELNPSGKRVIRVYSTFLSQASYDKVFDASYVVGVSGDNTFEQSVAHQVLPFYHSTNWSAKAPTLQALKEIVETVDFGFSEKRKDDLNTYFSYEAGFSGERFFKKFMQIDFDGVQKCWVKLADYLKLNRNFYNVFESIVLLPSPPSSELAEAGRIQLQTTDHNQRIVRSKRSFLMGRAPTFFVYPSQQDAVDEAAAKVVNQISLEPK